MCIRDSSVPKVRKTLRADFKAMMAIAKEHAPRTQDTGTDHESELAENEETKDLSDQSETEKPCKKGAYAKLWNLRLGHAIPVRAVKRKL